MFIRYLTVSNLGCFNISKLLSHSMRVVAVTAFVFTLAACSRSSSSDSGDTEVVVDGGNSSEVDTTPPTITSGTTATSIDESSGASQVIYTATSDDSAAVYTLSGTDSSSFTINASSGAVTLTANPDYETKSSYSFTVVATDSAGNSASTTVTLAVNDIALSSFSLDDIDAASGDIKQMTLTWSSAASINTQSVKYSVCEKDTTQTNNCNELMSVTDELTADVTVSSLVSALSTDYFILASSAGEFEASSEANVGVDEVTKMIGYFKASNTGSGDYFGQSVALSDDGTTLAVGAPYEYNSATGVITDGSETTDVSEAILSGAVYLFSHNSGKWVQTAYVKASNTDANDYFGYKVALSDDGTTLAVGAFREANTAKGVFTDGSEVDGDVGTADRPGAVYLFNNSGGTWTQIAYVKASNTSSNDQFGTTLALSGDGSTLAVGARYEDNATAGVITDGSEVAGHTGGGLYYSTGAVYVFSNSSGAWAQTAYVKSSSPESFDFFGNSVALSNDGTTLAVGAPGEDNGFTGILTDGSEAGGGDGTTDDSGAVYLFSNSSGTWEPTTYIKAADASEDDFFGVDLALSGDGETLVVGTPYDDNSATGVITDGSESVDVGLASDSGAVYLFSKSGGSWAQTTYFKASNPGANDYFGNFLALSDDGATLAVGAVEEDNSATGIIIDGSESPDNGGGDVSTAEGSGALYLFTITDGSWGQTAYIKASNTGEVDYFSTSIALNSDGTTLVISSTKEDNSATGIITDGSENSDTGTGDVGTAFDSGAVYIY